MSDEIKCVSSPQACQMATEHVGTIIAADGLERHYRIGHERGDLFYEDVDFDGLTLTLELHSVAEGLAIVDFIRTIAEA